MLISIITALGNHNVIGSHNKMPWHLPADFKFFKNITLGKPIIMGRKTFDSIGKPLPQRRNIIISRDKNLHIPGCEVFHSIEAALDACKDSKEVMIIGGATLYAQALPLASRMYITHIHHDFQGDTYFPQWNSAEWHEVSSNDHQPDEKNKYAYSFSIYEKNKY